MEKLVDDTRLELVTSRTSSGCATSCANRPNQSASVIIRRVMPICQQQISNFAIFLFSRAGGGFCRLPADCSADDDLTGRRLAVTLERDRRVAAADAGNKTLVVDLDDALVVDRPLDAVLRRVRRNGRRELDRVPRLGGEACGLIAEEGDRDGLDLRRGARGRARARAGTRRRRCGRGRARRDDCLVIAAVERRCDEQDDRDDDCRDQTQANDKLPACPLLRASLRRRAPADGVARARRALAAHFVAHAAVGTFGSERGVLRAAVGTDRCFRNSHFLHTLSQ